MEGQVIENAVQETVQETVDKVNSNWDQIKAYFKRSYSGFDQLRNESGSFYCSVLCGNKADQVASEGCEEFHGKGRYRHGGCPVHLFFWKIFAVSDSDF